jgi:alanyl-tRNA synthetase
VKEYVYSLSIAGRHTATPADIQLLKITSESAVAAGVRRIEALTGEAARLWLTEREDRLKQAAAALKASRFPADGTIRQIIIQFE